MKIKFIEVMIISFIVLQGIINILVFPNLESPDSSFHYQVISGQDNNIDHGEESLYYELMIGLKELFNIENVEVNNNSDFGMLNYNSFIEYGSYNEFKVSFFQIVHLFFVMIFIALYLIYLIISKLSSDEKTTFFRLYLLYLLWPSIAFGYMGISPDFFTYMICPFILVLLYQKKYISCLIIAIFIFKFIDEGIITFIYLIIVYVSINILIGKHITLKKVTFSILGTSLIFFLGIKFLFLLPSNSIIRFIHYVHSEYGFLPTKFLNLVLSLISYPGSGSYFTFPLIYPIVLILIGLSLIAFYKFENTNKIIFYFKHLTMASLIVTITTIILFPPFSHVRLFTFLVYVFMLVFVSVTYKGKILTVDKYLFTMAFLIFSHNIALILFIGGIEFN